MKTRADEVLVRTALERSGTPEARAAVEELFARYQTKVYLWCLRLVREREEALDLAQDALLQAYRGLPSFGSRSLFSSWLFAIARNRCLSALRSRRGKERDEIEMEELPDGSPGPHDLLLERLDEQELLDKIRDRLTPLEQEVIWLRCFERMPVETITQVLKVPGASGARGVLQTARRKLRSSLPAAARPEGREERS